MRVAIREVHNAHIQHNMRARRQQRGNSGNRATRGTGRLSPPYTKIIEIRKFQKKSKKAALSHPLVFHCLTSHDEAKERCVASIMCTSIHLLITELRCIKMEIYLVGVVDCRTEA